jgi:hypothetical protein
MMKKKKKKTPLFEQDSGVYMSIFFHDMIDERQNERASCVYIRFAIDAQR